MIPVLVSFAISFSLFGIVPQYVLAEQEEVLSPLAEETEAAGLAEVLALTDVQPSPSEASIINSPEPSLSPSPSTQLKSTALPTSNATIRPTPRATPQSTINPSPTTTPKPTPTATPRPTANSKPSTSPVTGAQLDEWFTKYANKESINRDQLRKIAICESNLNPNAVNGIYGGMYQFSSSTWVSTRKSMNADSDPNLRFNAEEAIRTGAFRIATMGDKAWPNCK